MERILLYIGGYLTLEGRPWDEVEGRFRGLGFDRVYPPGTRPEKAIEDLREDIQKRRGPDASK